jgi:hypothetical protein
MMHPVKIRKIDGFCETLGSKCGECRDLRWPGLIIVSLGKPGFLFDTEAFSAPAFSPSIRGASHGGRGQRDVNISFRPGREE